MSSAEIEPQNIPKETRSRAKIRVPSRARAALMVIPPAVLVALANIACNEEGERIAPTPTPRSSPVEFLPKPPPTADSQVVEVSPEVTPPQSTTVKPTATETVPSPEQTSQDWWPIKIQEGLPAANQFRTIEQDKQVINQIAQRFPHIGNLEITLIPGLVSRIEFPPLPEPAKMYVGIDVFELEPKVIDEFASYYDIGVNYERLAPHYSQDQIAGLLAGREEAIAKHQNFPHIEKMFSTDKIDNPDHGEYTKYPDALFLEGSVFGPYLQIPLMEELANQTAGQINSAATPADFRKMHEAEGEALKNASPLYNFGFTYIEKYLPQIAEGSANFTLQGVYLDSKEVSDFFKRNEPGQRAIIEIMIDAALKEALFQNDPQLLEILNSTLGQEKTGRLKQSLDDLIAYVKRELFARQLGRDMLGLTGENVTFPYQQTIFNPAN